MMNGMGIWSAFWAYLFFFPECPTAARLLRRSQAPPSWLLLQIAGLLLAVTFSDFFFFLNHFLDVSMEARSWKQLLTLCPFSQLCQPARCGEPGF